MIRQVVIVGAGGFVGKAIVERLRRGGVPAVPLSRAELDLSAPDAGEQLARRFTAESAVIMAARSRHPATTIENAADEIAFAAALGRAVALQPVAACVYFSTLSVYNDVETNLRITEDTPPAPTSPYGTAKLGGESILRQLAPRAGVPVTVLRPCKIYGPGDPSDAYGPARFARTSLEDGRITLYGDGTERRDHVFIDDVAQAACRLAMARHAGVLNLASGDSRSFHEMAMMIQRLLGRPLDVSQAPRTKPQIDQAMEITRLREALPGMEMTTLEEGLAATLQTLMTQQPKEAVHG